MITSTSNAQVKNIINLIKKSGERKSRGLFVIEGVRMFSETPKEFIESVYASESFACANKELLSEYSYEVVSDKVYEYMSDTKSPQGIMAVVKQPHCDIKNIVGADNPLIVILENIQDPGNLGTIIRTALGAGANGIIMSKDTVDIYNPKVVRSTMGAMFKIPFVYVESIPDTVDMLNTRGIGTYAAYLSGATIYHSVDYRNPAAIIIGNEGNGLTESTAQKASHRVYIPMANGLESLNAAVATSVILYEAARQRWH